MHKKILIFASILGFLAVALGAMGAHALKKVLETNQLTSFETAVRYQFYHVFAIFITAIPELKSEKASILWSIGIILFSGSIYLWLLTGVKIFVHITPVGGVFLMLGWIIFAWHVIKNYKNF